MNWLLLLWPVGVGHSWGDPSKCVQATHTTVFGHIFKDEKGPCICKYMWIVQEIENRIKHTVNMIRDNNKTKLKCEDVLMDSNTLTKRGKIIAICFHTHSMCSIQKPGSFWEISPKKRWQVISRLGLWLQWWFQIIRSNCQGVSAFLDDNNCSLWRSVLHPNIAKAWSGPVSKGVGLLMDFDKRRESECKRFWVFTTATNLYLNVYLHWGGSATWIAVTFLTSNQFHINRRGVFSIPIKCYAIRSSVGILSQFRDAWW